MKAVFKKIKHFSQKIADNNINAHAAACAFYTFLSLVPFVALVSSILPYINITEEYIISHVGRYIPDAMEALIYTIVDDIFYAPSAVIPISIVLTIWMSSRAFASMLRGIEDICNVRTYAPFLKRSLLACIYTIGLTALMVIVPLVWSIGHDLLETITGAGGKTIFTVIVKLRFLVIILILTLIFMVLYRFSPGMKVKFLSLIPGAFISAVAWLLFSYVFALFMRYGSDFSTYGSLAAIVICLIWIYWCMYIILLGAQINVFIASSKFADRQDTIDGIFNDFPEQFQD